MNKYWLFCCGNLTNRANQQLKLQRHLCLAISLIVSGGLSGCGNKGDLYLPAEPVTETTATEPDLAQDSD